MLLLLPIFSPNHLAAGQAKRFIFFLLCLLSRVGMIFKHSNEVRDDAEFFSVIKSNAFRTHFTTDGITLSGVVG